MITELGPHPIERLLMPLKPLGLSDPDWDLDRGPGESEPDFPARGVRCLSAPGPAQWLTAPGWRLYAAAAMHSAEAGAEPIERFTWSGGGVAYAAHSEHGDVRVPFSIAEAYHNYVYERWTAGSGTRGLPAPMLNLFYRVKRLIPRRSQLAARRALMRWQGLPEFPAWPYDESVAALLRFTIRCALRARGGRELAFRWFWPGGARAAAILSHDVESAAGLRNAVEIADLEEARGVRSSFNVVGSWYPIDWGIIEELRDRGFELGLHGLYHDRSLFSSRAEFERQLPMLRVSAGRLGAEGFRSPATHRVHDWIAELPFAYDCTVPLSDPYEPQPGGCCSPWPFFMGGVVELPYTLPQDHTLFTLLRHRTIDLWKEQVERLETASGLIQCLSHPDPGYLGEAANRRRYVEWLDFLATRGSLWLALPREVARWWIARGSDTTPPAAADLGRARLDEHGEVQLLGPRDGTQR